jgi:hypothetical protein
LALRFLFLAYLYKTNNMEQEKQTNPTMPERFFGLPRTAINSHHKYEFKCVDIDFFIGKERTVDLLNEYGQDGWQLVAFGDTFTVDGDDCVYKEIYLMREIYN